MLGGVREDDAGPVTAVDTAAPVRVLLVDDHPVVRRGLRALLSSLPGIEVAGEAASGEDAVREAQLLAADVVVMDVQLPGMDGVSATARLTAAVPGAAVLVLTMFEDDDTVVAALRAGARGYLLKGADADEIARALHAVHAGQVVLAPDVAARLVVRLSGAPSQAPVRPFPELTDRELQVLDAIAAGHSNTAIASGLGLAPKTVGNHISSVFAKLRVASRAEAIVLAREHGLGARPAAG
ncbi:response regulator transcription factor [Streptomyces sp. NP160]|nr:response regulator transcription factor [Streptomyces sp. NP160]